MWWAKKSTAIAPGTVLAQEGDTYTAPDGGILVKYGADGSFIQKKITGTIVVNNGAFGGDPKPFTTKQLIAA
jgi:hypothetical protein